MTFVSVDRDRAFVLHKKEQEILFDDDFSTGLAGWGGLIDSGIPNYYPYVAPVSVTGPYSMVLDTQGGSTSLAASAIKRLGLRADKIVWHSKVAWSGDNNNFLRYIDWAMDYEDSTARYWFDIRYEHFNEDSAAMSPKFQVNTGTASAQTYTTSTVTTELRYNQEQKLNFDDVTITLDMANKSYESIQINGVTHTLGNLKAASSPKLSEPSTYFTNGMNFLFTVTGRSNNSSADPRLYVDKTTAVTI